MDLQLPDDHRAREFECSLCGGFTYSDLKREFPRLHRGITEGYVTTVKECRCDICIDYAITVPLTFFDKETDEIC